MISILQAVRIFHQIQVRLFSRLVLSLTIDFHGFDKNVRFVKVVLHCFALFCVVALFYIDLSKLVQIFALFFGIYLEISSMIKYLKLKKLI